MYLDTTEKSLRAKERGMEYMGEGMKFFLEKKIGSKAVSIYF